MKTKKIHGIVTVCLGILASQQVLSAERGQIGVNGTMAGMVQHQNLSNTDAGNNTTNGAYVFQPEVTISPTDIDEFFVKFGFASGNGLNGYTPFGVSPWAADMEDDVKNINGRNRDYLLTAWYKHVFKLSGTNNMELYIGLIDGTDFLDENVYSNDELTQFMNQALVNGPNFFAPSYDTGIALAWRQPAFKFHGVGMSVGENDYGASYNYYGAELEFHINTAAGEGNYRATFSSTSADFEDTSGIGGKRRSGLIFSFDQEIGDQFGAFLRFGWQHDGAAIEYENIASGGIDIKGSLWQRSQDNIGIGFAHVNGGNLEIEHTLVTELYYRYVVNEIVALTLDLQYLSENYRTPNTSTLEGYVLGLRLVSGF